MGTVAIAVPIHRPQLRADEEISLRHLEVVLGQYPRFAFVPRSLEFARSGYEVLRFDDEFFTGIDAYSRLLLDPQFYRRFHDFEYLLIYQPDCLVFSDQLEDFCSRGIDYIGAPWLRDRARPERGWSRVGNGGLSLRRVSACLDVLDEARSAPGVVRTLARLRRTPEPLGWRKMLRVAREVARGIGWYRRSYSLNEDLFWADRAPLFGPGFRVADVATGLAFSFDEAPAYAYHRLGSLPMGCHGWFRRDREFWCRHLLAGAGDCRSELSRADS